METINCVCDGRLFTVHVDEDIQKGKNWLVNECVYCRFRYTVKDDKLWLRVFDYSTNTYRNWHKFEDYCNEND